MKGKEAENMKSSSMENVDNTVDRRSIQGAETKVDWEENIELVPQRMNQQVSWVQPSWDLAEHQSSPSVSWDIHEVYYLWWDCGVWFIYTAAGQDMLNNRKYEIM